MKQFAGSPLCTGILSHSFVIVVLASTIAGSTSGSLGTIPIAIIANPLTPWRAYTQMGLCRRSRRENSTLLVYFRPANFSHPTALRALYTLWVFSTRPL